MNIGGAAQQLGDVSLRRGHTRHQLAQTTEEEAASEDDTIVNKV